MPSTSTSLVKPDHFYGNRRAHRAPFRLLTLALVTALLVAGVPRVAAGEESVTCSCDETGAYKAPKGLVSAKDVEFLPSSATNGTSPEGTYQVSVSGIHPALTLTIRRSDSDETVLTLNTSAIDWGFSPDEKRFLTVHQDNGVTSWQLYDLTSADSDTPVVSNVGAGVTSSGRLGFSPKGNYLVFFGLVTSTMANVQFWDTTNGERQETGNFSFISSAPGQDKSGETYNGVTYGFGPDDHTFVYGYAASANMAQLNTLNLATGDRIVDRSFLTGFWQFSPCGDVLAMAAQLDQASLDIRLVSTADGTRLNQQSTGVSISAVVFEATEASHVMKVTTTSGVDTIELAPNTAGDCEAPGDTIAPTWPDDASITAGNITETTINITWSEARDNTAVTSYRVFVYREDGSGSGEPDDPPSSCTTCPASGSNSGGGGSSSGNAVWTPIPPTGSGGSSGSSLTLIGTLETDERSATITSLKPGTTYTFTVEAIDEAGNASENGPSVTATTTAIPVGEISGQAWFDSDGNGKRDSNESPLGFPQVIAWELVEGEITGQFTIGGWPETQSLADGRYFIRDLEPGTYMIVLRGNRVQSSPAGFAPHVVRLDANQGVRGVDFYVTSQTVTETGTSSISGTVWEDVNGNGLKGDDEQGIAGASVCAYQTNAGWMYCEDSSENGSYSFTDLPAGVYQVWADPETVGSRTGTLPPDDLSHIFTVASGDAVQRDLGFAPGAGAIEGTVWDDTNNNGVRDDGESGKAGIEVCQWGAVLSSCTLTGEDGTYAFNGLVQGEDYAVEITVPIGSEESFPAVRNYWRFDLEEEEVRTGIDFGVYTPLPGEIHGIVWSDINLNGQHDGDEPGVADIEVCYRPSIVALSLSSFEDSFGCSATDESGAYSFVNLMPNSYSVYVSETTSYPLFGAHQGLQVTPGGIIIADFGLAPPGLPPVVESISDQSHSEGDEIHLQVNATDPESGELSYYAAGLPAGLMLDEYSGIVSGTLEVGSADESPYAVTIYVVDEAWDESSISFTWTVNIAGNTPTGSDVVVSPLDEGSISIAFASVTSAGETSVVIGDTGPESPEGFLLGDPPVFYEISTTATFSSATLCIEYDDASYGDESELALFHYEDDEWADVTISLDTELNTICGEVKSFSPFVVLESDTTPHLLDCNSATPSIATLWPANHKMHAVTIEGVTSPDGLPATITITAIYQDEPVSGNGRDKHAPDGQGVGTSIAELRAERDGSGNGRVYHVFFDASDGVATCSGEVTVSVPKSAKSGAVDGGALFDSTETSSSEAGNAKSNGKKRR